LCGHTGARRTEVAGPGLRTVRLHAHQGQSRASRIWVPWGLLRHMPV